MLHEVNQTFLKPCRTRLSGWQARILSACLEYATIPALARVRLRVRAVVQLHAQRVFRRAAVRDDVAYGVTFRFVAPVAQRIL